MYMKDFYTLQVYLEVKINALIIPNRVGPICLKFNKLIHSLRSKFDYISN